MGEGLRFMDRLITDHHVGYCQYCGEWTAFKKHPGNAFTCPMCGRFGSPLTPPCNIPVFQNPEQPTRPDRFWIYFLIFLTIFLLARHAVIFITWYLCMLTCLQYGGVCSLC